MKKTILLFVFLIFPSIIYSAGGLTHMYIAKATLANIPIKKLHDLLNNHIDAYLVGSYYPDSGYVKGTHYGEESHWDPFIYAFADYLKVTYRNPVTENPKLVAFLFGCATHRISDEIVHRQFYPILANKDFKGCKDKAHQYGDVGFDILINVDKNQWLDFPSKWWIPVKDLLQVYRRMGHTEYTADEIKLGTSVIYFSGIGERLISLQTYPYLGWKMPWGAKHYYNYPHSGVHDTVQKVVAYQVDLWDRLTNQQNILENREMKAKPKPFLNDQHPKPSYSVQFSQTLLRNKTVSILIKQKTDGNIELKSPTIHKLFTFHSALKNFISRLAS